MTEITTDMLGLPYCWTYRQELTDRQQAILERLADGETKAEIAEAIGYSTDTVKGEIARIRGKLGARNQTHAVALAYHRGILLTPA